MKKGSNMSELSMHELEAQTGEVLPEREALSMFVGSFNHRTTGEGARPATASPPLPAASAAVPPQDLASVQAEALTQVRDSAGLVAPAPATSPARPRACIPGRCAVGSRRPDRVTELLVKERHASLVWPVLAS
jgi:hypothetical protein